MSVEPVKFYQVGSYAVGNRLAEEDYRSVQSDPNRWNTLTSGHRACQGCGEALGARYALDSAAAASGGDLIAAGVPLPATVVNTSSILLTTAIVCGSNAIAPVARDMANFVADVGAQAGEIVILDTDFEIDIKPYSLISVKGRALPPSAKLLYDLIWQRSRMVAPD